jgi:uncharacterized protein (TIGR02117 family)
MKVRTRKLLRGLAAVAAGLAALPFIYLLAALIGFLVPVNSGWEEAEEGVTIFIQDNGVHTWVVVPAVTAEIDWRPLARPEHLKDPRYARSSHLAFGFGNRDFYLNTPTWADLSVRTAAAALVGGGPSLMHVDRFHEPRPLDYQRPIRLTPEQYRRLTRYLLASFD